MTFASVMKDIFNIFSGVNAIVTPLQPVISIIPGGIVFNTIFTAVMNIETAFAGTSGLGVAVKKPAVIAIVKGTPGISVADDILSTTIDQIVAGSNSLQTAKNQVS